MAPIALDAAVPCGSSSPERRYGPIDLEAQADRHRRDHGRAALPRKEVIQPQLPLRLPCYDFVPVTGPTLDGCLPCGLAHRLQVLPAFMT